LIRCLPVTRVCAWVLSLVLLLGSGCSLVFVKGRGHGPDRCTRGNGVPAFDLGVGGLTLAGGAAAIGLGFAADDDGHGGGVGAGALVVIGLAAVATSIPFLVGAGVGFRRTAGCRALR
jgi:hypothetical protein